ncbi:unnamed protein product [Candida verbasci]|uniref:Triacylglycerol lipase n=1 Tax=Candida verbasci TaxID=1227364 RepID=A0A9W4U0R1_9ASCO|nr:unnamed protein product [Candida verbasci]
MKFISLFLFFSIVYSATLRLIPPSQDDFYKPAPGYEDAQLGDILKYRPTPQLITSFYFNFTLKNSWQIQYRSEDTFGNATAIILTVMEPYNADPSKVYLYQTFEDSSNIDCSPSYGFQNNAPYSTIASQIDLTFLGPALMKGYYVISPDYEGPKSSFTAGWQSGRATLDGVRTALKSFNITGIDSDAQVMLHGYSGGSIATGWAASLQSTYAPELKENLIGACVGGFVTNITATASAVDGGLLSGLTALALNGLSNEYPEFQKIVYEKISPKWNETFAEGEKDCLVDSVFAFMGDEMLMGDDPFFPGGYDLLKIPYVNQVVQENCLMNLNETYLPEIPIFIYHGTFDEVVPIKDVRVVVDNWCSRGIESLEFAEDLLNGHISEQLIGGPAAWTWIEKMFEGGEPVKGCSHTTRIENIMYPNISDDTFEYFYKYKVVLTEIAESFDNTTIGHIAQSLLDM